jgi:3-oxoacyl-[acyl-carrier-protein] synthase III
MGSTILALGHYAPQRRVTNTEIEARLGLEAGWIERRTGIRERRFAADGEALSDMAVAAGEMALSRTGFDPARIGLLILATSTPDHLLPPSAPLVAHRLGLGGAGAIDMAGACAGFLYALTFADAFVRTHGTPALVIAANILSRRINFQERGSAILFADAAGAALVAPSDRKGTGVLGVELSSDGSGYDLIRIPAGGSRRPFSPDLAAADTLMELRDGKAVFAKAVRMMADASECALGRAGLSIGDVGHWIPHQANSRMIAATQEKLGIADDKVVSSVALYGNSSAATIPLSMSLACEERAYKAGDRILMCAAGAGLTGGALVFGV